jgi:hypothetical protein
MLRGDNLISQPSLTTAKASYQNLAIANRGPGGTANCGPPPPAASVERRRLQVEQPGRVIPGKHPTKTQNMIYYHIFKIHTQN